MQQPSGSVQVDQEWDEKMSTVRIGISYIDSLEIIEGCTREYDLSLMLFKHRDDMLCFSIDEQEALENAVAAQYLLIEALRILRI